MLVAVERPGEYTVVLSTDDEKYGGWQRISHMAYPTKTFDGVHYVELYLPARTAVVLKEPAEIAAGAKKRTRKAKPTETAAKKTTAAKRGRKKDV